MEVRSLYVLISNVTGGARASQVIGALGLLAANPVVRAEKENDFEHAKANRGQITD